MAEMPLKNTVEELESLTRFDVDGFLARWAGFHRFHYPKIVDYYRGRVDSLEQESIDAFEKVREESLRLRDVLRNISGELRRVDGWELLDLLDEINMRIRVIKELPRFLRVSNNRGLQGEEVYQDYMVPDHETPEMVASKDTEDPQNDWVDIYIRSRVKETDYQAEEGGYIVELAKNSVQDVTLQAVVDRLVGENLYGKEIDKRFIFENDDVKTLSPRDTFRQAVEITARLNKGDVPEVMELGLSRDIAVGENLGVAGIPFISRELRETFSSDDTLVQFQVNDIRREGTAIFIDYSVRSFYDLVHEDSVEI